MEQTSNISSVDNIQKSWLHMQGKVPSTHLHGPQVCVRRIPMLHPHCDSMCLCIMVYHRLVVLVATVSMSIPSYCCFSGIAGSWGDTFVLSAISAVSSVAGLTCTGWSGWSNCDAPCGKAGTSQNQQTCTDERGESITKYKMRPCKLRCPKPIGAYSMCIGVGLRANIHWGGGVKTEFCPNGKTQTVCHSAPPGRKNDNELLQCLFFYVSFITPPETYIR